MHPVVVIFSIIISLFACASTDNIELIPKMVRWPTHIDHYLCRRLHSGLGVRSIAVTNLSGELCRTYCRVIDRMNGKITYTENVTPNFVRCGPYQARCVDGNCVGLNFPGSVSGSQATPPEEEDINSSIDTDENAIESAEVSNSDSIQANKPEQPNSRQATFTSQLSTNYLHSNSQISKNAGY